MMKLFWNESPLNVDITIGDCHQFSVFFRFHDAFILIYGSSSLNIQLFPSVLVGSIQLLERFIILVAFVVTFWAVFSLFLKQVVYQ